MAQPVVPAIASVCLETEIAQGQSYIIRHYEQVMLVYVLFAEPVSHGVTAQVHEGGGLEQYHLAALERCFGHEAIALVLKTNIGRLSKSVQYHVSCVVAGPGIFASGVSEATYQVLIHSRCYSAGASFASPSAASPSAASSVVAEAAAD